MSTFVGPHRVSNLCAFITTHSGHFDGKHPCWCRPSGGSVDLDLPSPVVCYPLPTAAQLSGISLKC